MHESTNRSKPRNTKSKRAPTKIVVRHLPNDLTEEEFLQVVSPLPPHTCFSFHPAEKSIIGHCYSRAYINFKDPADIFTFRDQFDGYVFVDQKGNENQAIVEYAPFQKVYVRETNPRKLDPRVGTILDDQEFLEFAKSLESPDPINLLGTEKMLEEIDKDETEVRARGGSMKTPLVEFLEERRAELLRKLEKRPHLEHLGHRALERIRRKEERKELIRMKKLERKKMRDEDRRRGFKKTVIIEEDEEEGEYYEEQEDTYSGKPLKTKENIRGDKKFKKPERKTQEREFRRSEEESPRYGKDKQRNAIQKSNRPAADRARWDADSSDQHRSVLKTNKTYSEPYSDNERDDSRDKSEPRKGKRYSVLKRNSDRKGSSKKEITSASEFKSYSDSKKRYDKEVVEIDNNISTEDTVEDVNTEQPIDMSDDEKEVISSSNSPNMKVVVEDNQTDGVDDSISSPNIDDCYKNDVDLDKTIHQSEEDDSTAAMKPDDQSDNFVDDKRTHKQDDANDETAVEESHSSNSSESKNNTQNLVECDDIDNNTLEREKRTTKDPRLQRKIRNKDRPAMEIYRPGQSRLAANRVKQDSKKTDSSTASNVASSSSSSPTPVTSEEDNKHFSSDLHESVKDKKFAGAKSASTRLESKEIKTSKRYSERVFKTDRGRKDTDRNVSASHSNASGSTKDEDSNEEDDEYVEETNTDKGRVKTKFESSYKKEDKYNASRRGGGAAKSFKTSRYGSGKEGRSSGGSSYSRSYENSYRASKNLSEKEMATARSQGKRYSRDRKTTGKADGSEKRPTETLQEENSS